VLVAAGGRLLACLATGNEVGQVDVMRAQGPGGQRGRLPEGHVFRTLWAIGPFVASLAAFVAVYALLDEPIAFGERLPRLPLELTAAERGATTIGAFLGSLLDSVGEQRLGDWRWWVFLYVGFALIVASAPSPSDLLAVAAAAAVVGLVLFGLARAGVDVVTDRVYGGVFWGGFSLLLTMGALVLATSALILLPLELFRRSKES